MPIPPGGYSGPPPLPPAPPGASTSAAAYPPPTSQAAEARSARVGSGKIVGILVAAAIVGGAAGLGVSTASASLFPSSTGSTASGPSTITVNNTDSVTATTAIAAKVVPSVVTISATSGDSGGTGSGVVLTSDGYVVTNTHVVTLDGATGDATLRVTTSDGEVYDAELVGTDPVYDLAVIKLTGATDLTPIEFADSAKLNVGDQAVAVGAPLGLSNSVTTGIVSALNRSIQIASSAAPDSSQDQNDSGEDSPFQFDFGQERQQQQQADSSISIAVIQTDAAINPGNSGGALVNGEGELIGVNVAIATAGGTSTDAGSIGVGFSIPSDIVKRVSDELISDGEATHGLLGATVGDAAAAEDASIAGALIREVTSGGPAASAGLQQGDIVTAFDGIPITAAVDLTAQVRAHAAGSEAEVTYVRDGQSHTVEVTLGSLTQ
ncbi:S1C family serine protease [Microbacterium sp.]|uniref:S1C family serine protease n=1 Tax=Microbacterium sp. TaxID=51671 RepID=UPI0039E3FD03